MPLHEIRDPIIGNRPKPRLCRRAQGMKRSSLPGMNPDFLHPVSHTLLRRIRRVRRLVEDRKQPFTLLNRPGFAGGCLV